MKIRERERAANPEDLVRLFTERFEAGDVEGVAELYEREAVLAVPTGGVTVVGRNAIRLVFERMLNGGRGFAAEEPLPTLHFADLALTTTRAADGGGGRAQVARRQPDGTWLRIIDRPGLII